ncbi:hypothetical protein HK12_13255 [Acetobacter orientalis]|uniref:Uncharacterized protein n=1 Tax=Acetobacter orientalis TaxID=146474 RepID=A0A252A5P0_9PROT|nr:hypothetical protein HK12_13255 [Acetobacter orientalis]
MVARSKAYYARTVYPLPQYFRRASSACWRATAVQVSGFLRCENLFQNIPPAFRLEATATAQSARAGRGFYGLRTGFTATFLLHWMQNTTCAASN